MQQALELAGLRLEDVKLGDGGLRMCIHKAKNDQLSKGQLVFIEPTGRATHLVWLFQLFIQWRGHAPGLLFMTVGSGVMSSSTISAVCQRMVMAAGLSTQVSSHSLRISGATATIEGGMTTEQVMTIGGWRSDAVNSYLRARELPSMAVSRRMGL
ncbi:phage integrase family protein [Acanthamoeba castellanii str. Neff]|uniref:Phage integrase family protein n=1 Tax=Acanthamoeba castellanii (strain ATCC 30010 / Neff) TaxID=1257118 RepID=L8GFD8_ACACF|nr:phage integrase family protein [Acanthamoeba castellanii str. Neff]ELR11800.1 phage integrase family protein [Acanthamoeba castellanii str. Neff]